MKTLGTKGLPAKKNYPEFCKYAKLLAMVNVETLYQENIRLLPIEDQLHLVELIMKRTGGQDVARKSALRMLNDLEPVKKRRNSDEIEKHLRSERDSWDN